MPQINNSGQVYVANGVISIDTTGGNYLASGSPLVKFDEFSLATGFTPKSYVMPVGVRGVLIMGANALSNIQITVGGATSGYQYLNISKGGYGAILAPIANGLDTSLTIQFVNNDGVARDTTLWWAFGIDDFGLIGQGNLAPNQVPLGIGKMSVITNPRTPVRLGDDSQENQRVQSSASGTGGTLVISSPGPGQRLVLWRVTFLLIPSAVLSSLTVNDGITTYATIASNSDTKGDTIIFGGEKCKPNTGLTVSTNVAGAGCLTIISYTVESV